MKKIYSMLLFLALSTNILAQEHLTFKDIPIDGHLNAFISKLESLGYKQETITNNSASLKGEFAGEECTIAVYASDITKTVSHIIVILEESDSWTRLKSTYREYKLLLTSKYGKGETFEYFTDPYYEGDGYELGALRRNECTYATKFEVPNGIITITIDYVNEGVVLLGYVDKQNDKLSEIEERRVRASDL